jgi:hypothetical protein
MEAFGTGRQDIIPGWFPKCAHLRQDNGDRFVEDVQEKPTQLDRIIYINLNFLVTSKQESSFSHVT